MSVFVTNLYHQVLLDIVDEDWLADCLSDDDIEIPTKYKLPADDVDDANEAEQKAKAENTWMEMGLQQFTEDPNSQ
eukprot:CAMPEP_0184482870 /NCGR_PEP_ID=MMETSP0113_2-20130426/4467_1 /TAXON_ID=91329 /ORGANISM="Norrisiella sphaerica, Strain BC52" /LENGTH=75 /DNA_ID=CAMNT_0026862887 /DNA_START=336 /DNA_END=564 /DNA_ORIENTATION=+